MKFRQLGSSGLLVSEIGFGTGGNAGLMVKGSYEDQLRTVGRAIELGVNYFDTSPDYGDGVSETNLGRVLRDLGTRPFVTTKVEVRAENLDDITGHIERSVAQSLRRLGLDYVDVVQIHNGPVATRPELRGRQYNVLSIDDYLGDKGALEGLRRVRDAGMTRFIGFVCRGDDGDEVRRLIDTGEFQCMNLVYTLLNPSAVSTLPPGMDGPDFGQVVPYGATAGVGTAVYSPLAMGVLTDQIVGGGTPHPLAMVRGGDSEARRRQVSEAAKFASLRESVEGSLAQTAMRFVLTEPGVSTVLGGFSDIAQLEEAVAASDAGPLSPDCINEIAAIWRSNVA